MDIREALLEEHSKVQCKKIVEYIGSDKKRFGELMRAFFGNEDRFTQRAAWPMSYCVQEHPELIVPYLGKMMKVLNKPGSHNAVTRNIARVLQDIEIPKKYHGKVMTISFEFINSVNTPIAVKAFSLTVLDKLAREYPEIGQELELVIRARWNYESPAFKSRARKVMNRVSR